MSIKAAIGALTRSLALVADAFGRKTGVKITIGGERAYTDRDLINIPAVEETNPRVMQLIWGYLAHEAAHVRFTQFESLRQMAAEGNALLKSVWNILEDIRVENAMIGVYPGTRSTMDVTAEIVISESDRTVSETDPPAQILVNSLLVLGRHQYRKQEFLRPKADQALQVLRKAFPSSFVLRLKGLMCDIGSLGSTQDAIDLARRIVALVQDEAQPQQPEETSDGDPSDESSEDPSEGDGGGDGDSDGEAEDNQTPGESGESTGDQGSDESAPDSGGPQSGDSANSDESGESGESDEAEAGSAGTGTETQSGDDSGTGEAGAEGEDQSPESGADGAGDQGDSDSEGNNPGQGNDAASGEGGTPATQASGGRADDEAGGESGGDVAGGRLALQAALDAQDGDIPDDLFAAVARELEEGADRGMSGEARNVFPEAIPFDGDAEDGAELVDRVAGESRRLTAQLHGIVQSETMTRHRTARRGRRLSAGHLHRAAVGDDRIFARTEERRAPNTAIHLLVDMSGSMWPPKCTLAMDAALALALALETMQGVSLAATAFPDTGAYFGEKNAVTVMLRRGQRVRSRAGAFVQENRGGTPLTEALWFTAAELLAAAEPRKVAIVLTDGCPNDRGTAQDLVTRMTGAGIEVIGIGIQYDASWLFPTYVGISELGQLKSELMRIARQLLIR